VGAINHLWSLGSVPGENHLGMPQLSPLLTSNITLGGTPGQIAKIKSMLKTTSPKAMGKTAMSPEAKKLVKQYHNGKGKQKQKSKDGGKEYNNTKETFQGECEGLHGKIYSFGNRQVDTYTQTTEAILDYIMREFTNGMDIREALEQLEDKNFNADMPKRINLPENASDDDKKTAEKIFELELKMYVERRDKYRINMVKAYGLIWGQCTKAVKNKLEARKDWNDGATKIKMNPFALLKALKEITHNHQDYRYIMESMYNCMKNVFTVKQDENENITDFTR